ncbi:Ig-like domain-containing protein, partial [Salmonella enterica subsp. enterica serovar Montevideo]|nr:Ig-like domain-containing protein [Salmonella enterica subsp. enterica serovar Montevideo]
MRKLTALFVASTLAMGAANLAHAAETTTAAPADAKPMMQISDGEHTFTVEQSDKAGNTSRVTTTPTIIVDTTPPDAAIIDNV